MSPQCCVIALTWLKCRATYQPVNVLAIWRGHSPVGWLNTKILLSCFLCQDEENDDVQDKELELKLCIEDIPEEEKCILWRSNLVNQYIEY